MILRCFGVFFGVSECLETFFSQYEHHMGSGTPSKTFFSYKTTKIGVFFCEKTRKFDFWRARWPHNPTISFKVVGNGISECL